MEEVIFFGLLFIVALLYGSVGHGGASGYLALMAIFNVSVDSMKPSALILNLFVSLIAFVQFRKAGYFDLKLFLPFALASVPLSFLGGLVHVDAAIYKVLLGIFLLFAVVRMLFFDKVSTPSNSRLPTYTSYFIGGFIGFLSGLLGIGGGIILSPILILLYKTQQKQAAAISALFIFVNSVAGLLGQWTKGVHIDTNIYFYVLVAFIGGSIGSYMGSVRINQQGLKYVLSAVLGIAIIKLVNVF
jgi:uncharacterized protein